MHLQYSACILFGLFSLLVAKPAEDPKSARILKYDYDDSGKGPYRYGFESTDGITREESGEIHYPGTKREFMKVTGVFRYPGLDGVMYEVRYTADDQGFHPEGDHIKVPPFVPWIHHDDGDSNDLESQQISDSTGESISAVSRTTSKPSTEYLPSTSSTYLPSTSTTYLSNTHGTTARPPTYDSGSNILDTVNAAKNTGCLPVLPCKSGEQESFGSSPRPSTVYLPTSPSPPILDDVLNDNLLSTPRPNPELHFHSTPDQRSNLEFVTTSPGIETNIPGMKVFIGPMGAVILPVKN